MPSNNSVTNRNIRRSAALKRFAINKQKAAEDEKYVERKEEELATLKARVGKYEISEN